MMRTRRIYPYDVRPLTFIPREQATVCAVSELHTQNGRKFA